MPFPVLDYKFEDTPCISCCEDIKMCLTGIFCTACLLARIRAGIRGEREGVRHKIIHDSVLFLIYVVHTVVFLVACSVYENKLESVITRI